MEAINVHQVLRPIRYAFVVKPDDLTSALTAVSINTVLWGGLLNPIVPSEPLDECLGLLAEFDPDELVVLTDEPLDVSVSQRFDGRITNRQSIVGLDDRTKKRRLLLGLRIPPLVNAFRGQNPNGFDSDMRVILVKTNLSDGWPEYVHFVFGGIGWLPPTDRGFEDIYTQGLEAREQAFKLDGIPPYSTYGRSAISFTEYSIRLSGASANRSSHIIYVGDHKSWADLVEFWNIRATGREVLFLPVAAYDRFSAHVEEIGNRGHYPINPNVDNETDIQKGRSIPENTLKHVCAWIQSVTKQRLSPHTSPPRFGLSSPMYIGDIHVANAEAKRADDHTILQNGQLMPIRLIHPDFLEDDRLWPGVYSWCIELRLSEPFMNNDLMLSFPRSLSVEKIIRRYVMSSDRPRISRSGIVVPQDRIQEHLYFHPARTPEIFSALFQEAGLKAEPSQPGRYADQIIRKMGRLHFDCRIFKIRGVREILDKLGGGVTLTKGNMRDIVMSTTDNAFGVNWRPDLYNFLYLASSQKSESPDFSDMFELLLEKRIIRPGMKFQCRHCFAEDWYHVSEFDEDFRCRFCFETQRVDFADKREWLYKADGLFRLPDSAQGSVAVIISLWRLADSRSIGVGKYLNSTKLIHSESGSAWEIDYAYLSLESFNTSYELVLGQASRFGDITAAEVSKMRDLGHRIEPRPYLAFTTLKDAFSDAEKRLLKGLLEDGFPVIALTREELDPYGLHDRFKDTPHPYSTRLIDLVINTSYMNLGESVWEGQFSEQ